MVTQTHLAAVRVTMTAMGVGIKRAVLVAAARATVMLMLRRMSLLLWQRKPDYLPRHERRSSE